MILNLDGNNQPPDPNLPLPSQPGEIPNKFKGKTAWQILEIIDQEEEEAENHGVPKWKMNFLEGLIEMLASQEMMLRLQKRLDSEQPRPERN